MPPVSPVKILFVGDMHLGRRASRIPGQAWDLGGFGPQDINPLGAWRRVVQTAIDAKVQAVALAGDVVHQDDDLFEAKAHLEQGIRQLTAAGIDVVAVAGNHDTQVLPALAEVIDGLHLLGPDGTWSSFTVCENVRLTGWSFPARHHTTSPLQQTPPAPEAGVVTLGLLHADLNAVRSQYAPVAAAELNQIGYQGWVLGHIHAPDPVPSLAAAHQPFYLGSISGAIPTETGAHGPVLATVSTDGQVHWERRVLAPLRWEHREVPVDALACDSELKTNLLNHLMHFISELDLGTDWATQDARALGLRLTLTGTHTLADAILQTANEFASDELTTLVDNRVVFIEKISSAVTVPMDLETLAREADLPGLLAREILSLRNNDPASAPLLAQARLAAAQVVGPPGLEQQPWSDDELRTQLIQAGQRALNTLVNQTKGGVS